MHRFQCLTLISIGALFLIFSIGQGLAFEGVKWSHTLFILGIVLFGLGTITAGIFPEDPRGVEESVSGKIHGIASGIGFLFLILNPLWALWIDELRHLRYVNFILFLLAALTFILFLLSEERDAGFFRYTGLFQRINLVILYGHLVFNYIWLAADP